jgi:hypothetical protein
MKSIVISFIAVAMVLRQAYIKEVWETIIYDPLTVQEFCLIGDPSLVMGGYES